MRFTNAYCPAPLCVPSRMSFMTSRTPSRNRAWNNHAVLSSAIPTWAHVLGAAGYETSLIGRMHFVGPDQRHGFENRPLGEYSAKHPGVPESGGPRWQKFPGSTSGQSRAAVEIAGTGTTTYQYFDERVAEATGDYLRERADHPTGRPFAAVAGFVLPHCPFIAPKELFDDYYDRVDIPPIEENQPATVTRFRDIRGILNPPLDEERIRIARAAYLALCDFFDAQVDKVLDTLDETGLARNTLVVYISDHGECAGEHGCWWKSNYYEGSVGVPMIARLPGAIARGSVSNAICNLTDLGPTFAEIAGAQMHRVDGRSLWPTLTGNHPADRPNETFAELVDSKGGSPNFASRMVRSGKWKLWVYGDDAQLPPALFDLESDPGELNDLGTDPDRAEVREALLARVHDGWDPPEASRATAELTADLGVLAAWGDAVRPPCDDMLDVPPPELEDDVVLL
jgi:choline-sulfatase